MGTTAAAAAAAAAAAGGDGDGDGGQVDVSPLPSCASCLSIRSLRRELPELLQQGSKLARYFEYTCAGRDAVCH